MKQITLFYRKRQPLTFIAFKRLDCHRKVTVQLKLLSLNGTVFVRNDWLTDCFTVMNLSGRKWNATDWSPPPPSQYLPLVVPVCGDLKENEDCEQECVTKVFSFFQVKISSKFFRLHQNEHGTYLASNN